MKRKIHDWFGLTYASYLVLPRSVLQSMPDEWQERFVEMLEELDAAGVECPIYRVSAVDEKGKFVSDPYRDYERGRRKIHLKKF